MMSCHRLFKAIFLLVTASVFVLIANTAFAWSIDGYVYSSTSLDIDSETSMPYAMEFNSDGTKFYVLDPGPDDIKQYSLSTPWDISTATLEKTSNDVRNQCSDPMDIHFKPDGTKLYLMSHSKRIYEYSLSPAWDISSISYIDRSPYLANPSLNLYGIYLDPNGTKLYVNGKAGGKIYQYSLSSAWDITTATYDEIYYDPVEDVSPKDIVMNSDGTKMYMIGFYNKKIFQYSLSSAWNVSTATYDSVSVYYGDEETSELAHFASSSDGSKLFVIGPTSDSIHEYASDAAAPTVSTLTPTDEGTDLGTSANLVMAFNENIGTTGTGYLTIYKSSDNSIVEQICAATGAVTGSGTDTLTINPTSNFAEWTNYYVKIDSNFAPDASGNNYVGVSDETTWNFRTADNTNPGVSGFGSSCTANACTITWDSNEAGSSQVLFGFGSGSYTASNAESNTGVRVSSHSSAISSLVGCTQYSFRSVSRDASGRMGTGANTLMTTACTGGASVQSSSGNTVVAAAGGTIELTGTNTGVTMTIPADAHASNLNYQMKKLSADEVLATASTPSGKTHLGRMYNFAALQNTSTAVTSFSESISIEMSYTDDDISGYEESTLKIYRYDGSDWYELTGCTVDTSANTVTCTTTAFSDMGIFGDGASGGHANNPAKSRRKKLMSLGAIAQYRRSAAPEESGGTSDNSGGGSGSILTGTGSSLEPEGVEEEPQSELPPALVVTGNELSKEMQKMKTRVCPRVERRFSGIQKMIDRVNKRLDKRFGFVCEVN